MALLYSNPSELGSLAPDFSLPGTDGKTYSLLDFKGTKGLLIVFMCNHCPYVIAVQARLRKLAEDFAPKKISVIGINSNDPLYKDADSFLNMKKTALEWGLPFPYLFDETQSVARSYDAVCTPDPYLFQNVGGDFLLRYRGRIDDSWQLPELVKDESLRKAMDAIVSDKEVNLNQVPSLGCSIKWKEHTGAALQKKKQESKLL